VSADQKVNKAEELIFLSTNFDKQYIKLIPLPLEQETFTRLEMPLSLSTKLQKIRAECE
jgi:hypothetical protein